MHAILHNPPIYLKIIHSFAPRTTMADEENNYEEEVAESNVDWMATMKDKEKEVNAALSR